MSYLLIVNFKAHFFCQTIYLSKTLSFMDSQSYHKVFITYNQSC